ncbi:gliding motility-associated-like protein [Mucilaginibacter sp. UYP25]|uniref:T9SS type B sorting domain-containing protein n=1 Tax=unclassified Mucilaginibacter TaxID=2617802 RepID=UPI003395D63F
MPINKLKFLVFLVFLLINVRAFAQVGNGSLGDPVFTFDFGSGDAPKFPTTGYTFVGGSCPEDGKYALSKTEQGCHPDTWHVVLKDHTGNDGFMMVVNADAVAGKEFFSKETTVDGTNAGALCENTTYEFSAYVLNLIKAGLPGFIEPNISFKVETLTGDNIGLYTVDIPPTSNPDGWEKYGLTFTTPPGVTTVVVRMVNNAPGGAGNDFLLDDITFRAYGPVLQAGFADEINVTQNNVCEGQTANYTITTTTGAGYNNPAYQWQKNTGSGWVNIDGEVNTSLNVVFPSAQLGSYQYRLLAAEGGNINSPNCRVYSNTVTINVTAFPVVANIPPQVVCEGDPIMLTATGGATYQWTLPDLTTSTQNPLIIPVSSVAHRGTYHVDVKSAAGCVTPKSVEVTVNTKPVITVSPPQSTCAGSGVPITAFAVDGVTYRWSPAAGLSDVNSANPVASPTVSTLYAVTVTNAKNCFSTNTVQVDVLPLPVANAGDDKKIFEGQSVTLKGSGTGDNVTYSWSPTTYLDNPASPTPTATPLNDITYTLTVTSANCGTNESSIFVRVYNKLVIPTSFTPNSDGINDLWNIEALDTYAQGVITIYTRNGKQVFTSKGYSKPWDGTYNGRVLPADTYYYIIDLKNNTPNLSGWVLLIR